eukprot:2860218-Pleurochrysis_carterae.AAC.1
MRNQRQPKAQATGTNKCETSGNPRHKQKARTNAKAAATQGTNKWHKLKRNQRHPKAPTNGTNKCETRDTTFIASNLSREAHKKRDTAMATMVETKYNKMSQDT